MDLDDGGERDKAPGSKWLERSTSDNLFLVGRLKPGVSETQARAELETITAQLGKDYPANAGRGLMLGKPACLYPSQNRFPSPES